MTSSRMLGSVGSDSSDPGRATSQAYHAHLISNNLLATP